MRAGAACAAALGVAGVGAAAWSYAVDDAYVLARYARRLATGAGYTFVPGPPTDGVTGPLGLLPGISSQLLVGDAVIGAKLTGLLCACLSVGWVAWRAGRERPPRAVVAAFLLLLWPLLGVWAVAGLETGLTTLACTAVAIGLVDRRPWLLGVGIGALAWLRPEAAPACALALALHAHAERRRALPALALAGVAALAVVGFRLWLFGSPLPLSAAAKPPDLGNGISYVGRALLILVGGAGIVPLAWAARDRAPERSLVAVLSAHAVAVMLAGGDWMPGFRLFVPWLPTAALVMSGPIAGAHRPAAIALFLGATLIPVGAGSLALEQARAAGRARETSGRALATWLNEHARRVALVDVGFLAYEGDFEVVDLGGITDPEIGRLPGGHAAKRIDPGLLRARDPDTIVLHSTSPPRVDESGRLVRFAGHPVELEVAAMGWVRAEMRVAHIQSYAPGVWYVVLHRAPDER